MIEDEALFEEFATEANEHLESIDEDLLALEAQGLEAETEIVNKAFRAIHSIKGGAGFLGLGVLSHLAHVMETVLDGFRGGTLVPSSSNISPLLEGTDFLRRMIEDPASVTESEIEPITNTLTQILKNSGSYQSLSAAVPNQRYVDNQGQPVDVPEIDEDAVPLRRPEHQHLYLLRARLEDADDQERGGLFHLFDDLEATGCILGRQITSSLDDLRVGMPSGGLIIELLYASLFDSALMTEAMPQLFEVVTLVEVDNSASSQPAISNPAEPKSEPQPAAEPVAAPTPAPAAETPAPVPAAAPPAENAAPSAAKMPAKAGGTDGDNHPRRQMVRVGLDLLDRLMTLAGELVLVRNRHLQMMGEDEEVNGDAARKLVGQLNAVTNDIQDAVMRTRMQEVGIVFTKLPRIVRDLSHKLHKQITLETIGNEVELDKSILESLADPLTHLIRNSCDHGIETPEERKAAGKDPNGKVVVSARHEAGQIVLTITDDGAGINPEKVAAKAIDSGIVTAEQIADMDERSIMMLIMRAGFSTAKELTDVSGRGVGMDVVKSSIEKLGGTVQLESRMGHGSTMTMRLPLTLAIISSLLIRCGSQRFALPQVNIEEVVCIYRDQIESQIEYANHQAVYRLRDFLLPLVWLQEVLDAKQPFDEMRQAELAIERRQKELPRKMVIIVFQVGGERFGLVVDDVLGSEDIVVKPMHPNLSNLKCFAGSTILGDGSVALIMDGNGIVNFSGVDLAMSRREVNEHQHQEEQQSHEGESFAQLIFTLGASERFGMPLPMIQRIVPFDASDLEIIGGKPFIQIDGQSIRVLSLDSVLPVGCDKDRKEYKLIIPRHLNRPVGVLAAEIIDVAVNCPDPDRDAMRRPGIIGTAIIDGITTLYLDLFALVQEEEPSWFDSDDDDTPIDRSAAQNLRVLLAEDTKFFQSMIGGFLRDGDHQVTVANHGQEAWDILQEQTFDIIVSDIEMPHMNGWELGGRVRKDERLRDIPMMALTALAAPEHRERAMAIGFDAYEVKIDRERLLDAVADVYVRRTSGLAGRKS